MTYFDNAATTNPKPEAVRDAVNYAMSRYNANPGRGGHDASVAAGKSVFSVREKLTDFFGMDDTCEVVFTKNCTESLNIAVKGLLKPGDHVITSALEHNSVLRPLEKLRTDGVITYDVAPVYPSDDETLESFEGLIRSNTKMIVCAHVSNVFGLVLPVERLGALAQKHGLLFVLDAAQSAGVQSIDAEAMKIDALCLPGHKGLYGPMGTGCLLLRHGVLPAPLIEGGTGSFSSLLSQPQELPDALESGTLNVPGIVGLGAGIDFVRTKGTDAIRKHEQSLTAYMKNALQSVPKITVYPRDIQSDTCLFSFTVDGMHSERVAMLLNDMGVCVRAGYHCAYSAHQFMGTAESGTVRVSPGAFSTQPQAALLVDSVRQIAAKDEA